MYIKSWGSRGSIPVSGKEYIIYGGDTTCLEIRTASDDIIIIDAGTGIRRLGNALIQEDRFQYHFIFTHAHWDHVMGFPFFKPLFLKRSHLQMHRCPFHSKFVETVLSKVMAPPYFPLRYSEIKAQIEYEDACPDPFEIGSVIIDPIALSHPNAGSGYKFTENGKSFVFLTDNELGFRHPQGLEFKDYLEVSAGADLLIHDAEYTPDEYQTTRKWGHSTYPEALRLALEAGASRLGLFHLNQDRTDAEMDQIVADCRQRLRSNNPHLECFAVTSDMTFEL
ncbi:MAG: MBL fold metallo-hydrolase [Desulfobacterales bacterium]